MSKSGETRATARVRLVVDVDIPRQFCDSIADLRSVYAAAEQEARAIVARINDHATIVGDPETMLVMTRQVKP